MSSADQITSLRGTSLCKENKCETCICRLSCSFVLLEKNLEVVAMILGVPTQELFPTLEFHKYIIGGKE